MFHLTFSVTVKICNNLYLFFDRLFLLFSDLHSFLFHISIFKRSECIVSVTFFYIFFVSENLFLLYTFSFYIFLLESCSSKFIRHRSLTFFNVKFVIEVDIFINFQVVFCDSSFEIHTLKAFIMF